MLTVGVGGSEERLVVGVLPPDLPEDLPLFELPPLLLQAPKMSVEATNKAPINFLYFIIIPFCTLNVLMK